MTIQKMFIGQIEKEKILLEPPKEMSSHGKKIMMENLMLGDLKEATPHHNSARPQPNLTRQTTTHPCFNPT